MFSIVDKNGTIFSADSAEKTVELYRAFHSERNDDGWITWNGGECPVADGTKVEYRLRGGEEYTREAHTLLWENINCDADIVAYKVVK